jgi:hypothetical protein
VADNGKWAIIRCEVRLYREDTRTGQRCVLLCVCAYMYPTLLAFRYVYHKRIDTFIMDYTLNRMTIIEYKRK